MSWVWQSDPNESPRMNQQMQALQNYLGTLESRVTVVEAALCDGFAQAASGDTTPSVKGIRLLELDNHAAGVTHVTTFDDGVDQQLLVVAVSAGDLGATTLKDSVSLQLIGGVDFAAPSGSLTLKLFIYAGNWYELPTPVWD